MRLFRISNILTLALAMFFGILLFWTSQAVQQKENELSGYKKNLHQEEETVRVLAVEWDYLTRPQRLEKLAHEQLGMELPSAAEMVTGVDQIPQPVIPAFDPDVPDAGAPKAIAIDYDTAYPKPVAIAKKSDTVAPTSAEKQSFDKLIETLDTQGGEGR